MSELKIVLLSGGSGARLWPLSREACPKQFLSLVGDRTLFQTTWLRVRDLPGASAPLVIANDEHRFLAAEQLQAVGAAAQALILEPVGRNTAPAIAVAALRAMEDGADPVMLVLPSDHVIADEPAFRAAVLAALPVAEDGGLVTFGIVPNAPVTGYGYIKAKPGQGVRPIERFVEKPDLQTAQAYLAAGDYFWNSGMFLLRASRYLDELAAHAPGMLACCRDALAGARIDLDFLRLDRAAFAACPADSIDYAVMEKTGRGFVLPIDVGWSDVGSWSALADVSTHDALGNAHRGDVLAIDTRNTLAWSERRLLALVGLDDMVVVDTDDAVLVAHKDRVQDIKQIVARLKRDQRPHATLQRKVFRPWGSYDGIDRGPGFQVKRIAVKPGASLSLQMHRHRAEHWIVVKGRARVTRDEEVFELVANQSTYIPRGARHRLQNAGDDTLELIEVQSGDYLGEDDIVRFEDDYGRTAGQ
ncbi:MAG: mannose-1-phosphate guanylyltransferase/mannose-6-phosphate isomerase [Proteobacteria bacterium]|nr:mannose-1-phosphate guanylyltransferase/mannose-6-phosphate isomerase [Pseudomonadota bacterium]